MSLAKFKVLFFVVMSTPALAKDDLKNPRDCEERLENSEVRQPVRSWSQWAFDIIHDPESGGNLKHTSPNGVTLKDNSMVRQGISTHRHWLEQEIPLVQGRVTDLPAENDEDDRLLLQKMGFDPSRDLLVNMGDIGSTPHSSFITRGLRWDGWAFGSSSVSEQMRMGRELVIIFKDLPKNDLDSLTTAMYAGQTMQELTCFTSLIYFIERYSELKLPRNHPEIPTVSTEYVVNLLKEGLVSGDKKIPAQAFNLSGKPFARRLFALSSVEQKMGLHFEREHTGNVFNLNYRQKLGWDQSVVQGIVLANAEHVESSHSIGIRPTQFEAREPENLSALVDGSWVILKASHLHRDLPLSRILRLTATSAAVGGTVKVTALSPDGALVLGEWRVSNTEGKVQFFDLPLSGARLDNAHQLRLDFSAPPEHKEQSPLLNLWKIDFLR